MGLDEEAEKQFALGRMGRVQAEDPGEDRALVASVAGVVGLPRN